MFDVLIVGAGMVGASLACALGDRNNKANSNLKVGIVEARADLLQGQFGADGRASAVALGSTYIWRDIGVWDAMVRRGVTPMDCIQVSDGNYPNKVQLRRHDVGKEALGYIVENKVTQASLWEFIRACSNIEPICPAKITAIQQLEIEHCMTVQVSSEAGEQHLKTKLLVAADGGRSLVRSLAKIPITERAYEQTCIVVTVKPEYPHNNTAYERFQSSGPFAILPLPGDRCSIVWTATREEAPRLLALDDEEFIQELSQKFGTHLGKLTLETRKAERGSYVPRWMHAETYVQPRLALVGDAAHTTHPVAGQGMNLGIRDVGALAEVLLAAHRQGKDIGAIAVLQQYQAWRRWDNLGVILLTDITNRAFSNHLMLLQWLRRLGLAIVALLPFKKILMYLMMGLVGRQPKLSQKI